MSVVVVCPDRMELESGGRSGRLARLDGVGRLAKQVMHVDDIAAAIAQIEAEQAPRWLWSSTSTVYTRLLAAGTRVRRCHDLELTEALLLGYEGSWGQPRALAAIWARLTGAEVPADAAATEASPPGAEQLELFEAAVADAAHGFDPLEAMIAGYASQLERIAATTRPGRLRLLVAAESAGALVATELGHVGLPWSAQAHDEILAGRLGEPAVVPGAPPRRLVELTEAIRAAFGEPRLTPESPAELLRAFSRAGIVVASTRSWVLREVEHPAVPLILEFKELHRLWTAHGWAWRAKWVHSGRFYPEYVPGGVVSGRWATRGGGALQIPKAVRGAVVADEGWVLVVADASQLEPRILAAVSADGGLIAAAQEGDLYQQLATAAFGGDRARAKLALLGAVYGQTGGAAAPAVGVLQAKYPAAWRYVEQAARSGESGELVRSWLGRTCPPGEPAPGEAARARGRFTRNFVIQATAAEWALTLLGGLRLELFDTEARLVFFQHDEVVVHAPIAQAQAVEAAINRAATLAGERLFGAASVRFPMDVQVVRSYADAC